MNVGQCPRLSKCIHYSPCFVINGERKLSRADGLRLELRLELVMGHQAKPADLQNLLAATNATIGFQLDIKSQWCMKIV